MLKKLAKTSTALLVIQISNALIPLTLYPYFSRQLDSADFAAIILGLTLLAVANLITDFGFNLSATLAISRTKILEQRRKIYGAVILSKFLLAVFCGLLVILYSKVFTENNHETQKFLALLTPTIIAVSIQPTWILHGLNRLAAYAASNLLFRFTLIFAILSGHTISDNLTNFAIKLFFANLMIAIFGWWIAASIRETPSKFDAETIKTTIKNSLPFFFSRSAVSAYTSGTTLFIGSTFPGAQLALYATAEQLYKIGQLLVGTLSQAIYVNSGMDGTRFFIKKISIATGVIAVIGVFLSYVYGGLILSALYGPNFSQGDKVLLIFSITFLVTSISTLYGYPFFAAIGRIDIANKSVMIGGLIQLTLLFAIWQTGEHLITTVAATITVTELAVLTYRLYFANQTKNQCLSN
ncbi:oligosaccharide flippase family protein [Hydrogenophaga sp. NFH-34]|uniref:oligosaccharide flippase family protein n=1 Tax=Hydrogenophaga sp. NFH-34 TaxID=2744446 RepID=UPI001F1F7047|nr:oligosaccharide flippase family protein [Hydrogenophaga sp. NFH-34]